MWAEGLIFQAEDLLPEVSLFGIFMKLFFITQMEINQIYSFKVEPSTSERSE